MLFTNLVIYGPGESAAWHFAAAPSEAGFQILPQRLAPNGGEVVVAPGPVDNMVISNVTMINVGTPFYVAYSDDAPYSANNLGVGRIFQQLDGPGAGQDPVSTFPRPRTIRRSRSSSLVMCA